MAPCDWLQATADECLAGLAGACAWPSGSECPLVDRHPLGPDAQIWHLGFRLRHANTKRQTAGRATTRCAGRRAGRLLSRGLAGTSQSCEWAKTSRGSSRRLQVLDGSRSVECRGLVRSSCWSSGCTTALGEIKRSRSSCPPFFQRPNPSRRPVSSSFFPFRHRHLRLQSIPKLFGSRPFARRAPSHHFAVSQSTI